MFYALQKKPAGGRLLHWCSNHVFPWKKKINKKLGFTSSERAKLACFTKLLHAVQLARSLAAAVGSSQPGEAGLALWRCAVRGAEERCCPAAAPTGWPAASAPSPAPRLRQPHQEGTAPAAPPRGASPGAAPCILSPWPGKTEEPRPRLLAPSGEAQFPPPLPKLRG